MPLWAHVCRWVAVAGTALVVGARSSFRCDRNNAAQSAPLAAAGRSRCRRGDRHTRRVRLFPRARSVRRVPVRPGRHQVPRGARRARRHAARLPRAVSRADAVLLRQSILAARSPRCPRCWRLGVALAVLRDAGGRDRTVATAAARDGAADPAGHADRGAAVRAVSAARRTAVGHARRQRRAHRACPTACRPGSISELSLSDAVAFRVDFDGAPPPPSQRYWRGPVFSRFDGATGARCTSCAAASSCRRPAAPIDYTVTLEPHGKLWLFALEHPAGLPRAPSPTRRPESDRGARRRDLRPAAAGQGAGHAGRALHACVRSLCGTFAAVGRTMPSDNLQLPRGNPRTIEFARELRARSAIGSRVHRRGARLVPHRAVRLHAGAAASRPRSGRRVPVRHAARLLRALRGRLRRAAARRRHSGARRHRLPGRRNESERRLHDRAPVRRARVGRSADRRASGSASIRPPRSRRRASSAASAPRCRRASASLTSRGSR